MPPMSRVEDSDGSDLCKRRAVVATEQDIIAAPKIGRKPAVLKVVRTT